MIACTTTWSKCSSGRRRTGRTANGRACEPAPDHRTGNSASADPSRFRATWSCASTIPNWDTTRATPNNSARPEIFIPRVMCTRFLGVCWRGSLTKYGGRWDRQPQIEILELGPGRGLFAQDVLAWSEKKFPQFFHALHYSLAERSPKLRDRLGVCWPGYLESGKASSVSEERRAKHLHQMLKPWFSGCSGSTAKADHARDSCRKLLRPMRGHRRGHDFSRARQCHGRAGFSPRGSGHRFRQ